MAKFTIAVDNDIVGGITAARERHNADLPEYRDGDGNVAPHPDLIDTDEDYFSQRVTGMVQSWADQHGVSQASKDKAVGEYLAKRGVPLEKRDAAAAAATAAVDAELAKR